MSRRTPSECRRLDPAGSRRLRMACARAHTRRLDLLDSRVGLVIVGAVSCRVVDLESSFILLPLFVLLTAHAYHRSATRVSLLWALYTPRSKVKVVLRWLVVVSSWFGVFVRLRTSEGARLTTTTTSLLTPSRPEWSALANKLGL